MTVLTLLIAMCQAQGYYRGYPVYNYRPYPVRPQFYNQGNQIQAYRRPYYRPYYRPYRQRYYYDTDTDDDWDDWDD